MNKIHPFITLGLLIVLTVFTYFQKNSYRQQLELENKNFSTMEQELKDIQVLKNRWENTSKKLDVILKQQELNGITIKQEDFKTRLVISLEMMTSAQMKFLATKIFNGYLDITKISFKKENDKISALIEVEK